MTSATDDIRRRLMETPAERREREIANDEKQAASIAAARLEAAIFQLERSIYSVREYCGYAGDRANQIIRATVYLENAAVLAKEVIK